MAERKNKRTKSPVAKPKTGGKPSRAGKPAQAPAGFLGRIKQAVSKDKAAAKSGLKSPPSSKASPARKGTAGPKPRFRFRLRHALWRTVKWGVVAAFVVCMIPVVLTLIYAIPSSQPVSALMIGQRIVGNPAERAWVSLDEVSPFVVQSVISSEDGKFCAHNGVDWEALNLVIDDALEGEKVRGASTITMQTVKNLYLWSSRSYVRKGLEVPLALYVDGVLSKRRILEIYLNIAEWGPGIYGIEAAAQFHFRRSARKLSRRQAALLAVTLPNPILRNPTKPGRGLRRLSQLVERRARASGAYIKCVK